ncbi:hypothetical protein BGZ99_006896 [Dissophora globulifera]|uniref:Uncharacterized protein n=1 Tax=Dissophora globulifera TaxID=979702 RepID=A0A9P6UZF2_9FUNG|nr:hypothetical protein BGZ99_006896 [Dissophora globulifera]
MTTATLQRFLRATQHNGALADALCRINDRATSSRERQDMSNSLDRIRAQYPDVPQHDTRLLLVYALTAAAYDMIQGKRNARKVANGGVKQDDGSEAGRHEFQQDPENSFDRDDDRLEALRCPVEEGDDALMIDDFIFDQHIVNADEASSVAGDDSLLYEDSSSDFDFDSYSSDNDDSLEL